MQFTIPADAVGTFTIAAYDKGMLRWYDADTGTWIESLETLAYDTLELTLSGSAGSKGEDNNTFNPNHFFPKGYQNHHQIQYNSSSNHEIQESISKNVVGSDTELFSNDNRKLMLYPNPAISFVKLKNNERFIDGTYQVFNFVGKLLMSGSVKPDFELNVKSLPTGSYYIQFNKGKNVESAKFIKK